MGKEELYDMLKDTRLKVENTEMIHNIILNKKYTNTIINGFKGVDLLVVNGEFNNRKKYYYGFTGKAQYIHKEKKMYYIIGFKDGSFHGKGCCVSSERITIVVYENGKQIKLTMLMEVASNSCPDYGDDDDDNYMDDLGWADMGPPADGVDD